MDNKQVPNNSTPPVTHALRPTRPATDGSFQVGSTHRRPGRPKGSPNKITQTFRDVLLQAVSEVD
jgi:hypothetical protein